MELLIVTQVVDTEHPVLGFFHRWIEEFAKQCDSVIVICLQAGSYSFPDNVTVLSLGKERGASKWQQLRLFYAYAWQYRHSYDRVFVHMNQLYVLLAGALWRILRKRIDLWYTHGSTPLSLKLASCFVHHIFTASPESLNISTKKKTVVGHGIDTELFTPTEADKDCDLILIGRISRSKNIETLFEIMQQLKDRFGFSVILKLVGVPVTAMDVEYEKDLKHQIEQFGLNNQVQFTGAFPHQELPSVLATAKIFVTTAQNGSLDKVMLEAMACGLPIVSMAPGSRSLPLGDNQVSDVKTAVAQIKKLLESGDYYDEKNREHVISTHSLPSLVLKLL